MCFSRRIYRPIAEVGGVFGYGFGDDLTNMREVFEKTAAAFEQRRANRTP